MPHETSCPSAPERSGETITYGGTPCVRLRGSGAACCRCDQKLHLLLKSYVREHAAGTPAPSGLLVCLLTEVVLRLLLCAAPAPHTACLGRLRTADELLERILAYIDENICEPLTIPELCEQFSLSRSSLQLLFKNALGISPKKYINEKKLSRSCQMLLESRCTVSEIAFRLGYSSIHYFSKAFHMKYHLSPSEFAKKNRPPRRTPPTGAAPLP